MSLGSSTWWHATEAHHANIAANEDKHPFAVCLSSKCDVIIGRRWCESKRAYIDYETSLIPITHRFKRISIMVTVKSSDNLTQQPTRARNRPLPNIAVRLRGSKKTESIGPNTLHLGNRKEKEEIKNE